MELVRRIKRNLCSKTRKDQLLYFREEFGSNLLSVDKERVARLLDIGEDCDVTAEVAAVEDWWNSPGMDKKAMVASIQAAFMTGWI